MSSGSDSLVLNGDFREPPGDETADITVDNGLSGWPTIGLTGTAITARWIADAASGSGGVVRFTVAAGAAGDEMYFEQLVNVQASRGRAWAYNPAAAFLTASAANLLEVYCSAQFLTSDPTVTTGTTSLDSQTFTALGAGPSDRQPQPNGNGTVPSDAVWLRLRIGCRRGSAATSVTGTVLVADVRVMVGETRLIVVDGTSPSTRGPARIYQDGGILYLSANRNGSSGTEPNLYASGASGGIGANMGATTSTFLVSVIGEAGSRMAFLATDDSLLFGAGGGSVFASLRRRVTAGGAVITGTTRYGVKVGKTAADVCTTAVDTAVTWDTEDFDDNGFHSNVTNNSRITAPIAGTYLFGVNVQFANNAAGDRRIALELNGATTLAQQRVRAASSGGSALAMTYMYALSAGDYIRVIAMQDSGGNLNLTAVAAAFWMYLVGE